MRTSAARAVRNRPGSGQAASPSPLRCATRGPPRKRRTACATSGAVIGGGAPRYAATLSGETDTSSKTQRTARSGAARGEKKNKEGPLSEALSRYGASSPRLISAACPASWPASGSPEENLCRYFFFFLPAFFFAIFVFSLALDLEAELLFFLTGIDTSLTLLLPDKHPKLSGWAVMASPSGRIIETRYSEIK